jgi:hypothetical protein
MQSTQKFEDVKTLARVRGIKEFSPKEMNLIIELCSINSLDPKTILDEVTDAPKYRTERAVKSTRSTISNIFAKLSEAIKP